MKQERLTYYRNQIDYVKRILWDYRLLFMAASHSYSCDESFLQDK